MIAIMEAWRQLAYKMKGILIGEGVRVDLCCGAREEFLAYRRACWVARFKCSLPKRPRRPIRRNMLPKGA
eukprot:4943482-Alexandrium_andersonii.AAC.1